MTPPGLITRRVTVDEARRVAVDEAMTLTPEVLAKVTQLVEQMGHRPEPAWKGMVRKIVGLCTLKNPPFQIRGPWVEFAGRDCPGPLLGGSRIVATACVKDRDHGGVAMVTFMRALPPAVEICLATPGGLRDAVSLVYGIVRELLQEIFTHEFAEAFHVAGRRVNDPHETMNFVDPIGLILLELNP